MSLGNETYCYQWYEEYQKLSYCPTETPKSTHPGKKTKKKHTHKKNIESDICKRVFFLYIFEKWMK